MTAMNEAKPSMFGAIGQLASDHLAWIALVTVAMVVVGIDALDAIGLGVIGWIVAALGSLLAALGIVRRLTE